ncbi:MAG: UDP-galactopyranose mutase [Gaiellaceae bacterium]
MSRTPDFDVLCLSHLRWAFVWQRPQHLMSRCAETHRVLYVEEPVIDELPALDVTEQDGVTVVVPHVPAGLASVDADALQAALLRRLLEDRGVHRPVAWIYTPMMLPLLDGVDTRAVVYDCMDDLSGFLGAPPLLRVAEAELLRRADVVFAGGRSLYAAKRHRHPNVHLFASSVDVAHFAQARTNERDPDDQAPIPRPRLGYAGVIDERLDLQLVGDVARARRDWRFVFLGPVVKIDESTLPQGPNLHYLGGKPYTDLPAYLAGWDVALMPFALNEATRFISPTKTPEYLAAGLPVVSTAVNDVVRPYGEDGLVRIANDPGQFVAACEAAMAEDREAARRRADSFLTESSWDYTWADMHALVVDAVEARRRASLPARSGRPPARFDAVVVGAGFAGSVFAERLATELRQRVLVVERRPHIGGNAFDCYDDAGVLVHRYGPHIFHTNSAEVFQYLSNFTEWRPYEHRVLASVDGLLVPFPINLDTVNALYNLDLSADELERFLADRSEPRDPIVTSEDAVVSRVGKELYLKFFRNYTRKQWGMDPSELDASVAARVPARATRDGRYFTDTFQAMPRHGYTRMFERMLHHPNIKLLLNTDVGELGGFGSPELTVYSGPIDEFFGFRHGKLPYRSLEFRFETHDVERHQPAAVVNYPNEQPYTRVTEFKYLTGQIHPRTTLVYEYPRDDGDPYYPVPKPENAELYAAYKRLADEVADTVFVGRLATYRYYNMDQVVAQSLATFRRLRGRVREEQDARDFPAARAVGRSRVHRQSRR